MEDLSTIKLSFRPGDKVFIIKERAITEEVSCKTCNRTGKVYVFNDIIPKYEITCPTCDGKGTQVKYTSFTYCSQEPDTIYSIKLTITEDILTEDFQVLNNESKNFEYVFKESIFRTFEEAQAEVNRRNKNLS